MKKKQPYFLVIGLGASGVSMAKFLHARGESVVATDIDSSRKHIEKEFGELGIKTEIGFHDQETFNRACIMVPSPGIPLSNQYIKTASANGVRITGELDIFNRYNKLPVIAITGTNGKTSTTTLIGEMLRGCGKKPFVGGNIGTPLLEQLLSKEKNDIIVAEVSSFQLDISKEFRPNIGVLLNISEDHLDRYSSYQEYKDSKWSLFTLQNTTDTAVINRSISDFDKESDKLISRILPFTSSTDKPIRLGASIDPKKIQITTTSAQCTIETRELHELRGVHNHENIAAAVLACLSSGADIKGILLGLKNYKNLSHRLALVKRINEVSFFNDSKATNTDAVIRAIECLKKNIILILGGRKKGTDFSQLHTAVKKGVKSIVAIGESKQDIQDTFESFCPVLKVQTMKEAVQKSFESAVKNDVILLSPACASFDMYDNYAQRGNDFEIHVNRLEKEMNG